MAVSVGDMAFKEQKHEMFVYHHFILPKKDDKNFKNFYLLKISNLDEKCVS